MLFIYILPILLSKNNILSKNDKFLLTIAFYGVILNLYKAKQGSKTSERKLTNTENAVEKG